MRDIVEIRELTSLAEFTGVVDLQKEIWGFADIEILPVRLFVVASKIGGLVLGAFDRDYLIGFCLALPGLKPDGAGYWHSQILGIRTEYRSRGIGKALKLYQRGRALQRKITSMEWVFDPLEPTQAHFNIEVLGCIVRTYVVNRYGNSTSPFQRGLPTDRLVAEWWLSSPRVECALSGNSTYHKEILAHIPVSNAIAELRLRRPDEARAIQQKLGDTLRESFAQGLSIVGYERGDESGTYLLGPWKPSSEGHILQENSPNSRAWQ